MNHPVGTGVAIAGSILSMMIGIAVMLGSLLLIGIAQSYSSAGYFTTLGLVLIALAVPGVVLGYQGRRLRPGIILANAVVHTVLTVAAFVFMALTVANIVQVTVTIAYAVTAVVLHLGVPQARNHFYSGARTPGQAA